MIKLALLTQSFIGIFRRKNFFYKLFNSFLAFFLIFSLAFVTIETVDPEPVFAASWDCLDSNGRPIAFQTKYSSGSLEVKRYNFSTNTEATTTFSSGFSGTGEINASFMDLDGNLYVQRKKNSDNGAASNMYLVNPSGSPTLVSSSYTGVNLNAATFFVDNGYEYAIYSKGHFSSGGGFARFASNSDTSLAKTGSFSTSYTGSYNPNRSNAKDFAWIQDNSSFPSVSGSNKPDFIGVDGANQKIYASKIYKNPHVSLTHTNRNKHTLRFELTEGKNREIRNICEIFNLKVERLKRISFGQYKVKSIPLSKYKEMTIHESY